MARYAKTMPEFGRDSDLIATGVLAKTFPLKDVRIALSRTSKMSQRERLLPNHVVLYYCIFMALFSGPSVESIMMTLLEGLRFIFGPSFVPEVVSKSGISQARQRIGFEPMVHLFDSLVRPIAVKRTRGAFYERWRLVALDGSCQNVADTKENVERFGRPKNGSPTKGAFPQIRFVTLVEIGTHVIFGAAVDGIKGLGELELAKTVLPKLQKGMLCLADRFYPSHDFFLEAKQTGADLLFRVKKDIRLDVHEELSDGSYLSRLHHSSDSKARKNGIPVRVIAYKLVGIRNADPEYRLVTTILDPELAPAEELAALYQERWEVENILDELKNHLKLPRIPLRGKVPDLVLQEFWSFVLGHFATRGIMHEAALQADLDPDEISFTHTVEVIRRNVPMFGNFPPAGNS